MAAGAAMIALTVYVAILAAKAVLAWWYVRNYPKPRKSSELAPVTICQAILSGDPDLGDALESTVVSLPRASFVWLIDEDDTDAARITARLSQAHPQREITVISLPAPTEGINPKLFKLEAARVLVPSGVFLVLDDDTRLTPVSLAALIDALDRSDLATGLPFYRDSPNVFGRLLAQFVNNNSALTYLPLVPFVPPVSINGMCYALHVETLSRLHGFEPIMRHLTDDLAVADRIRLSGGRIVQTPFPQEVATTLDSFTRYTSQMHRWYVFALLLMRRQTLALNTTILLLYGVPPVLLAIGFFRSVILPSWGMSSLLAGALLFRGTVLSLFQWHISGKVRHRPLLSLLSEVLQPLHLMHAVLVKSIRWRSRHYRVYDNDHFTSV
jgi:ceramide glucosyltransferase